MNELLLTELRVMRDRLNATSPTVEQQQAWCRKLVQLSKQYSYHEVHEAALFVGAESDTNA